MKLLRDDQDAVLEHLVTLMQELETRQIQQDVICLRLVDILQKLILRIELLDHQRHA